MVNRIFVMDDRKAIFSLVSTQNKQQQRHKKTNYPCIIFVVCFSDENSITKKNNDEETFLG